MNLTKRARQVAGIFGGAMLWIVFIAFLALHSPAGHAASVNVTNVGSCTYSGIVIDATGNMTISCQGLSPPPVPTPPPPTPTPPPPPPVPSGCPAISTINFHLNYGGNDIVRAPSNTPVSSTLDDPSPGARSQRILVALTSISPTWVHPVEVSVSKCKGDFDTTKTAVCYWQNSFLTNIFYATVVRDTSSVSDPLYLKAAGICVGAPVDGTTWYVNFRWTYNPDECSLGTCGYVLQWNEGGY